MEKAKSDKRPFFLQISHYAVHSNIETREKTFTAFKSLNKNKSQKGYASMTSDLDKSLGMILEKIKALGIDKNTYIIYTSDNGAVPRIPMKRTIKKAKLSLTQRKMGYFEGGIDAFCYCWTKYTHNSQCSASFSGIDIL